VQACLSLHYFYSAPLQGRDALEIAATQFSSIGRRRA
jgi:hypothetical protein